MEVIIIKILVAIFVAGFFGHLVVVPTHKLLKELRKAERREVMEVIATWLGIFERTISALAWFGGQPFFIGVWFTAKVIGNWARTDPKEEGNFSSYLLNTGISISFAILVAIATNWILDHRF